jgi:hypothetical protein
VRAAPILSTHACTNTSQGDLLVNVPPDEHTNASSIEYFGNSIEQAVNNTRHFRQQGYRGLGHQYESPAYGFSDKHQISKLSFEMWVSLPEKMEEALHNYTRLQSNRSTAEPTILENIKSWRSMYPRLDEIINHWTPSERCDIIMLDASFQLMSDFPPKGSKLGISLELDFMDPSHSNHKALEEMQVWEGSTTIYDRGRIVREAWYNDCHSTSIGTVKPFFESKYWATTFTDLTERRRRAEDLKSDAAIEVANERSRSQLKHLTVIQEIYARPSGNIMLPRKRMAILLWKFSQAPPHWAVGITTWQRIIPPPDRLTTNSPPPTQELGFPLLAMDSAMDMAGHPVAFDLNYDWTHFDPQEGFASFGHDFEDELCQDGAIMSKHSPNTVNSLASLQASFNMEANQGTASHGLHSLQPYSFHLPLNDSEYVQHHEGHVTSGNLFESEHRDHGERPTIQIGQGQQHVQVQTATAPESPNRSQHPLTRFDVSTHRVLQAQLGQDCERGANESNGIDEEALRRALVAASANELGNGLCESEDEQNASDDQQHNWTAPHTTIPRPQLQSHASFVGQSSHAHHEGQQHGLLQEISQNVAGFDAGRMVAALSTNKSCHPSRAPTHGDDRQPRDTHDAQDPSSYNLDDDQCRSQGGHISTFPEIKAEVQLSMGASFGVVSSEDTEQSPVHEC